MIKPPLRILALIVVFLLLCESLTPLLAGSASFQVSIRVGSIKILERGKVRRAGVRAHHTFYAGGFKGFRSISSSSLGEAFVSRSLGWGYSAGSTLNFTGKFNYSEYFNSSFSTLNYNSSLEGEGELYSEVSGSKGSASARLGVAVEGNLSVEQYLSLEGSVEAVEALEAYGKRIRAWASAEDELTSASYELTVEDLRWPTPESAYGNLSSEAGASSLVSGSLSAGGDVVKASSSSASPTGNYSASSEAYNATLTLKAEVASSKRETGTSWNYYGYGAIPTINETFYGPGITLTNYLAGEGYPYNVSGSVNYASGLTFSQSLSNLAGKVEAWRLTRGSYVAHSYLNCTGDVHEEVSISASAVTYKEFRDVNASGDHGLIVEGLMRGVNGIILESGFFNGREAGGLSASIGSPLKIEANLSGTGVSSVIGYGVQPGFHVRLSSSSNGSYCDFSSELYNGFITGYYHAIVGSYPSLSAEMNLKVNRGPSNLAYEQGIEIRTQAYNGRSAGSWLWAYNSDLRYSFNLTSGHLVEAGGLVEGEAGLGRVYFEHEANDHEASAWIEEEIFNGTLVAEARSLVTPASLSVNLSLTATGQCLYVASWTTKDFWNDGYGLRNYADAWYEVLNGSLAGSFNAYNSFKELCNEASLVAEGDEASVIIEGALEEWKLINGTWYGHNLFEARIPSGVIRGVLNGTYTSLTDVLGNVTRLSVKESIRGVGRRCVYHQSGNGYTVIGETYEPGIEAGVWSNNKAGRLLNIWLEAYNGDLKLTLDLLTNESLANLVGSLSGTVGYGPLVNETKVWDDNIQYRSWREPGLQFLECTYSQTEDFLRSEAGCNITCFNSIITATMFCIADDELYSTLNISATGDQLLVGSYSCKYNVPGYWWPWIYPYVIISPLLTASSGIYVGDGTIQGTWSSKINSRGFYVIDNTRAMGYGWIYSFAYQREPWGLARFHTLINNELNVSVNASVAYEDVYYHTDGWKLKYQMVPDVQAEGNLLKRAVILEPYNFSLQPPYGWWMWESERSLADARYMVFSYSGLAATINKLMTLDDYNVVIILSHMNPAVVGAGPYGYVTDDDLSQWYVNPPYHSLVILYGCESFQEIWDKSTDSIYSYSPLAKAFWPAVERGGVIAGNYFFAPVPWGFYYLKTLLWYICEYGMSFEEADRSVFENLINGVYSYYGFTLQPRDGRYVVLRWTREPSVNVQWPDVWPDTWVPSPGGIWVEEPTTLTYEQWRYLLSYSLEVDYDGDEVADETYPGYLWLGLTWYGNASLGLDPTAKGACASTPSPIKALTACFEGALTESVKSTQMVYELRLKAHKADTALLSIIKHLQYPIVLYVPKNTVLFYDIPWWWRIRPL